VRRSRSLTEKDERGFVITVVAVVLLFVVGAMAVLAIDVAALYTARSEAQLAADGAALAAARVLANSGMTSDPNAASDGLQGNAEALATQIAKQVAMANQVGGRNLNDGDVIDITYPAVSNGGNPLVIVQVSRSDLPTFFARIWGRTRVSVVATATAEAYNPSGLNAIAGVAPPVAQTCVKPWLLPNIDPSSAGPIFDTASGAILTATLLGGPPNNPLNRMWDACTNGNCSSLLLAPQAWKYYPGDPSTSFPPPPASSVACTTSTGFTPYQLSVAGCIQVPIACNSSVNIDTSNYPSRDVETASAVDCLTSTQNDAGDQVDFNNFPSPPFQFLVGTDDPIANAAGKDVFVSNSLVTVPVYNSTGSAPTSPVQIIGFVQLFLNPRGFAVPTGGQTAYHVRTTVINMVGCGTNATGQPILGNGSSAVAVRLISSVQQ
jgi:hypothetical protein